jgi:hypothetical protein
MNAHELNWLRTHGANPLKGTTENFLGGPAISLNIIIPISGTPHILHSYLYRTRMPPETFLTTLLLLNIGRIFLVCILPHWWRYEVGLSLCAFSRFPRYSCLLSLCEMVHQVQDM